MFHTERQFVGTIMIKRQPGPVRKGLRTSAPRRSSSEPGTTRNEQRNRRVVERTSVLGKCGKLGIRMGSHLSKPALRDQPFDVPLSIPDHPGAEFVGGQEPSPCVACNGRSAYNQSFRDLAPGKKSLGFGTHGKLNSIVLTHGPQHGTK